MNGREINLQTLLGHRISNLWKREFLISNDNHPPLTSVYLLITVIIWVYRLRFLLVLNKYKTDNIVLLHRCDSQFTKSKIRMNNFSELSWHHFQVQKIRNKKNTVRRLTKWIITNNIRQIVMPGSSMIGHWEMVTSLGNY